MSGIDLLFWLPGRRRRTGEVTPVENTLGYVFRDPELLRTALTHPSVKASNPGAPDYQRLEFLGDAVLGLVFAETLYADASAGEGVLTDARTRLARGSSLASVGRKLELGQCLILPENGDSARIRDTDTAHEDALEAIFGAVFLDGGLDAARTLAQRLFAGEMQVEPERIAQSRSPKNRLQELVQQDGKPVSAEQRRIEYRLAAESGPPHARHFEMEVWVDGVCCGRGAGVSKRAASEAAAEAALSARTNSES
ncbi:MAG: ribonuclease III [Puniceicoccales bacterium]|jgi:ribonuclease-3|nr:ribonuclease III [Puniceicoccales bacterium]